MTTKLTLSINEKTVQRAKRLSRKRGKSISKMVKEYLDSISEKEELKESPVKEIEKIMSKYKKNKTSLPADGNYNKIALEERYEAYMKKIASRTKKK